MNPPGWRALGQPRRWGYGAFWWVWDAPVWPGNQYATPFPGACEAMEASGQYITVLPAPFMVIGHKVNIDEDPQAQVTGTEYDALLQMAIACGRPGTRK